LSVVILARSLETGGMQRQLVELARRLPAEGHPVQVVLFYGGNPVMEGELTDAGIPLTVLGKRSRWDLLRFAFTLAARVREMEPEVVYSFLTVPNLTAALLRPFWRSALIVWGVRDSNADFRNYSKALWLSFLASRGLARRADRIVFNSHAGRSHYLRAGYPRDRAVVVPNGIDTQRFRRDEQARAVLRRSWGVTDSQQLVGVVARLDPMKGHVTFLEAAAHVKAQHADVRFVCVGPGPADRLAALKLTAERAGVADVLVWAGEANDVVSAYSALDVLCLPSWTGEGFPNVVGEGMACGLPAVVTDVGDAAAVVGPVGIVVPPRDAAALAAGLELVLRLQRDDPGQLAAASRRRVEQEFDARSLAERTVAAFSLPAAAH
jgi:glycosyltransferase involved in cell wall biosynthesis